jgi:uncharacterized protein
MNSKTQHPVVWLLAGGVGISLSTGLLMGDGVVRPLLAAAAALGVYLAVMRGLARRRTPELGRAWPEGLRGLAVGATFLLGAYAVIGALGGWSVDWSPSGAVLGTLAVALGSAVCEELLFRGVALQALERLWGRWWALGVTAAFFGIAHLFNPDGSLWGSLCIAVEAGLMLGAAYLWRRNLWFAIGVHAAWNGLEGLLGVPVSGHREPGLWATTADGAGWLTGGGFGLEASVVTVLLGLALSVWMLRRTPAQAELVGAH